MLSADNSNGVFELLIWARITSLLTCDSYIFSTWEVE